MKKHCEKCSYETEEGLAITGCAFCGCHNSKVINGNTIGLTDIELNDGWKDYHWNIDNQKSSCLHDNCGECRGTGRKRNGEMCIHAISCPCPKCGVRY